MVPQQVTKTIMAPRQVSHTVMVPRQVTSTVMEDGQVLSSAALSFRENISFDVLLDCDQAKQVTSIVQEPKQVTSTVMEPKQVTEIVMVPQPASSDSKVTRKRLRLHVCNSNARLDYYVL